MLTKKVLNLDDAKKIAAAAEAEALRNKWLVIIAILDDGGHLIYLQRLDGAQFGSIDVAIAKAHAAIAFKRPTKAWEELVNQGHVRYMALPGSLPLEGGLPLIVDGQIVGAIGVSGVKSNEDAQIAKAGADTLG